MYGHEIRYSRFLDKIGSANDGRGLFEIIPGSIAEPVLVPTRGLLKHFHAVAKSADLGGTNVIQIGRLHNFQGKIPRVCPFAPVLSFDGDVILTRAVTGLAGDAQL